MYTFIIFFKSRIWNSVGGPPDLKGHAYKVVLSMRGLKVSYPKVNFIVQVQYLWKEKNEIFLIVSFRPVSGIRHVFPFQIVAFPFISSLCISYSSSESLKCRTW